MAKVKSSDPNQLVFRQSGGNEAIPGLMILIVAIVIFIYLPSFLAIPIGGFMAIFGTYFVLKRTSITFDTKAGKMTFWKGLLVVGISTDYDLAKVKMVSLLRMVRKSSKNTTVEYHVFLEGDLAEPVLVHIANAPSEGHHYAETIAKYLNLPMKDTSMGNEIIREAGTLDYSIRQQYETDGKKPELLPQPDKSKSTHTATESTHKLHIPATGVSSWLIYQFVLLSILLASIVFVDMPFIIRLLGLFILLPIIKNGFLPTLASVLSTTYIEVSPSTFVVEKKGPFSASREEISGDDLEGINIVGQPVGSGLQSLNRGQFIFARSDEKEITFGLGLENDELEWLVSVMKVALCS